MFIDAHAHAAQDWTMEAVEEGLKRTGVDRVLLAASPLDYYPVAGNEACARIVERFPDRIWGLIGIHPPDEDASLRALDRYHGKGFAGVKLMTTAGYYPDDERYRRVFEEVGARNMIVLTHCGWAIGNPDKPPLGQCTLCSDPYHFEPFLRLYPDADVIFAHGGGRTLFPGALNLVHYHPNAWVDTCPGNGPWVFRHGGPYLDFSIWDQVLFGTDDCYGNLARSRAPEKAAQMREILDETGRGEHTEAVFGGNAARLLEGRDPWKA